MEIEDSRGGFIASCAQVLTLIDFKTEGKMYSGLVDMSATSEKHPTIIHRC